MTKKNARVNSDEGRLLEAEEYLLATAAFVLADAMERSGLTQCQVAERLGVSEARVSQLLNASGNPTVRTLARVADALSCKVQMRFIELEGTERRPDAHPVAAKRAEEPAAGVNAPVNDNLLAWTRFEETRRAWSRSKTSEPTRTSPELDYDVAL